MAEVNPKMHLEWKGRVRIRSWNKNGKLVKDKEIDNLVVDTGIDSVLKTLGRVANNESEGIGSIGVGSSTSGEGVDQLDLQGSNTFKKDIPLEARIYARPTLFVSIDVGYAEANFTWAEIGLFDTKGVMIARIVDPSPLNKNDRLRSLVEWRITI